MDGVHDMGGMQGFGAVDPTDELRWSKADWRARMFAIELSYTQPGGANVDWLRHVLECMPPAVYLGSEYFDRWYWRDAGVLANADWVDIEELRTGKAANRPADAGEPLSPEAVPAILEQGVDSRRAAEGAPAFKPGDRARARFHSPLGATRLPRYTRGHAGTIEAYHGWYVLPDANACGDERAEPLYTVGFLAKDLWDDVKSQRDMVFVGMWESYLEPI
jgi:nitrile hydratase beta subunit